jgi:hypothetical protein
MQKEKQQMTTTSEAQLAARRAQLDAESAAVDQLLSEAVATKAFGNLSGLKPASTSSPQIALIWTGPTLPPKLSHGTRLDSSVALPPPLPRMSTRACPPTTAASPLTGRWRTALLAAHPKLDLAPGLNFRRVLGDALRDERGLARRLSRITPWRSRHRIRPELVLELNQSAHHCSPMMCRWRLVWVRLGLTSNSKR